MLGILIKIPQNTGTNSNGFTLKTKSFREKFYFIFRIYRKWEIFSKKHERYRLNISEIILFEKR